MDEPCAVHFVGILQSRDHSTPTVAQVYNYTGSNGLLPDFNGTINVTQAGIPFSSGNDSFHTVDDMLWLSDVQLFWTQPGNHVLVLPKHFLLPKGLTWTFWKFLFLTLAPPLSQHSTKKHDV